MSCDCASVSRVDRRLFVYMKEFKTIDEQIELLINKGVSFNDIGAAKKLLLTNNYYNVINGYKDLFLNENGEYINGTSFEEIYALYDFDRSLREILLKYILKIENTLRTLVSYYFSQYHGNDNYLRIDSFETFNNTNATEQTKLKRLEYIQELIIKIQQKTSKAICTKEYIKHYMLNYGFVPLWVLVNIFSFGELSKFLEVMKQKERIKVSKHFNCKEEELIQFVRIMNYYRNLCAHDERIYNTRVPKYLYIKDCKYHKLLQIKKDNQMYKCGKSDLFALIISLKYLLSEDDFNTFCCKIYDRIFILKKYLHTRNIDDIFKIMNFPNNWKDIKKHNANLKI